jgi:LemA protein
MSKGLMAGLGCLAIIVIAVVILGFSAWGTYNGLVTEQQNVEAKWAQVENVYQRRSDLIPNLVATVKGYAAHESETLQAVTPPIAGGLDQNDTGMLNDPAALQI